MSEKMIDIAKQLVPLKPAPFPPGDKSYIDLFHLNKENVFHYFYTNKAGEKLWLVKIEYTKTTKSGKIVTQISYNDGRYVKKNVWSYVEDFKKPFYRLHELLNTDKDILIVEGEKKCEQAQQYFPDLFCTTWQGGRGSWKNGLDKSVLKDRKIILWNDIDADGKGLEHFEKLCLHLKSEYNCNAALVKLPSYEQIKDEIVAEIADYNKYTEKKSYDLGDKLISSWEGKLQEMVKDTYVPEHRAEIEYSSIEQDLKQYCFITETEKIYYCLKSKRFIKKEALNQLYKRDHELEGLATNYLQRENCRVVDRITFRPGADQFFEDKGTKYLNKYEIPKYYHFKPAADYISNLNFIIIRKHIETVLANGEKINFQRLEDIIASDFRHPHKNRKYMVVFNSSQGVGKSWFFTLMRKLYGSNNCVELSFKQLTGQYQNFLLNSCYLFVNEIESSGFDDKGRRASLKTLVDGDTHYVEIKNVDLQEMNCHYTIWGATNETIPMFMAEKERRTFYLEINKTKDEIEAADPDYYSKLWTAIEDEEALKGIYHYYRYEHKISDDFTLNHAPETEAKLELIQAGRPQYQKYIDRLVENQSLTCLKKDIVNMTTFYEELVSYAIEDDLSPVPRNSWKETHLKHWRTNHPLKHFKMSNNGVAGADPKNPEKRPRLWCIRNHELWKEYFGQTEVIIAHVVDGILDTNTLLKNKNKKEATNDR
ncbi:MAG: hypothetical protein ISQ46_05610 [Methylophilaceae bacterium]|nr:hypothetical protein [Methylophilaceae bacterium]